MVELQPTSIEDNLEIISTLEEYENKYIYCFCCNGKLKRSDKLHFKCFYCHVMNDLVEHKFTRPEIQLSNSTIIQELKEKVNIESPLSLKNIKILYHYTINYKHQHVTEFIEIYLVNNILNLDKLAMAFSNGQPSNLKNSGIDLMELNKGFNLIMKMPQKIIDIMMNTINYTLKRPGRPFQRKRDVKYLLILLLNPLLNQMEYAEERKLHLKILSKLIGFVSNLKSKLHQYLIYWIRDSNLDTLKYLIELINKYITLILKSNQQEEYMQLENRMIMSNSNYKLDWRISAAAKVMAVLYATNKMNNLLPISCFYNSTVDFLDLSLDFDDWRNRSGKFSFCQYPFLISMASKVLILELDALRQMREKLKEVIHSIIFQHQVSTPFLNLKIRRQFIIEDSLNQLSKYSEDLKKKLIVKFINEDGIDAGGLTKEWFMLIINELTDPKYGLFIYEKETQLYWFNPHSFESSKNYYLIGVIVGLAIYNSTVLDLQLPSACFKKLFNIELDLDDLIAFRPTIGNSLKKLLNYYEDDIEHVFNLDFTYCFEKYGQLITVPLIENGHDVLVNHSNKKDYVNRYINYIFNESIEKQFKKFKKGFYKVCGGNALSLFQPLEIELLICGNPSPIDIDELMALTEYDGFNQDELIIEYFWNVIKNMEETLKREFLAFVTGSKRLPLNGTSNFTFKLSCLGEDINKFPVAHTCFNQLCLPKYPNQNMLESKLIYAIKESSGFTLV